MERKPEQQLWDRMRKGVWDPRIRLERIENAAGEGIPDVLSISAGKVRPIELKTNIRPARASTPLLGKAKGLRLSQRNWHLDWRNFGGTSLIVIGIHGEDYYFCIDGRHADNINPAPILRLGDLSEFCGPAKTFWRSLKDIL